MKTETVDRRAEDYDSRVSATRGDIKDIKLEIYRAHIISTVLILAAIAKMLGKW